MGDGMPGRWSGLDWGSNWIVIVGTVVIVAIVVLVAAVGKSDNRIGEYHHGHQGL